MITEELRPQTINDLIGNKRAINKLKRLFETPDPRIFIYGEPGIGKTSAAYVFANEHKLLVLETNASDSRTISELRRVLRESMPGSLTRQKKLILLDEIDGIDGIKGKASWDIIRRILKTSPYPVILIANNKKRVPESVQKLCSTVPFYKPNVYHVVKYLKSLEQKYKQKFDYSGTTSDIRSSINNAFNGGEKYIAKKDVFDIINSVFKHRNLSEYKKREHLIWLMDNLTVFYDGKDLLDACRILAMHDVSGSPEVLELLPRVKLNKMKTRISFPFFIKKMAQYKRRIKT